MIWRNWGFGGHHCRIKASLVRKWAHQPVTSGLIKLHIQISWNVRLRINNNAGQVTVVEYSAVLFSAALLSEKPQHGLPDLRHEGLLEVFRSCHETQHALSTLAARVETLSNVSGVGDKVLLIPEAEAPQAGNNPGWWVGLWEISAISLP